MDTANNPNVTASAQTPWALANIDSQACQDYISALLSVPVTPYPKRNLFVLSLPLLRKFVIEEFEWLKRYVQYEPRFTVAKFESTGSTAVGRSFNDYSVVYRPASRKGTYRWFLDQCFLDLGRFSKSSKPATLREIGYAFLTLGYLYDLLLSCPRHDLLNSAFLKSGHLLASLSNCGFLIVRESGGRLKNGTLIGIDKEHSIDSDGSFMCGILSLRVKNPYLFNVIDVFANAGLLEVTSRGSTSSKEICEELSHAPSWFQYMISIMYNRVRERRVYATSLRELLPVKSLSSGLRDACKRAGVSETFGETYAGNRGRLGIKTKNGLPAWRVDVDRFRKNVVLQSSSNFVSGLLRLPFDSK